MNLQGRNVWQVAAGDTNRNYADLCLQWGVILNGPARYGAWPECEKSLKENGWGWRKVADIQRFAEAISPGDVVVLRLGTSTVCGVGTVIGPYEWSAVFGDVDGWDLQHVRRVKWLWTPASGPAAPAFQAWDLKLGDTTQPLSDKGRVRDWLEQLPIDEDQSTGLPPLPRGTEAREVSVTEISEDLFDKGVSSNSIAALVDQMDDLQRIARWYARSQQKPSEHETVAYLVVPLLRTLGWTPQRMAVEWNRVDVALFQELPRSNDTLRAVVEAKKMSDSCLTAVPQAFGYAYGKASCHRLVVTDGLRYGVFVSRGDAQNDGYKLHAYMNLERLRDNYPIYDCAGASEALWALTPEWRLPDPVSPPAHTPA